MQIKKETAHLTSYEQKQQAKSNANEVLKLAKEQEAALKETHQWIKNGKTKTLRKNGNN